MAAEKNGARKPVGRDLERILEFMIIPEPLISFLQEDSHNKAYELVIDLNLVYPEGREAARKRARELIEQVIRKNRSNPKQWGIRENKSELCPRYLFARLTKSEILELVELDSAGGGSLTGDNPRCIYKIWYDFEVEPQLTKSLATIKADAARAAFSAVGKGIVWAVIDSGIDANHLHFRQHGNLQLRPPVAHVDFTGIDFREEPEPTDETGHGTHVAGIIAGEFAKTEDQSAVGLYRARASSNQSVYRQYPLEAVSGVAPQCKLVSLKVSGAGGGEGMSNVLAAIGYIQMINSHGQMIQIHGVNISLGHDFDPEWFASGQSPLCNEVDRLSDSGVCVVVAAGNGGYGALETRYKGKIQATLSQTIRDPGNAANAITVGATHREFPHRYGASFFSAKGPTGDGRVKPDLLAPGEKVISCATGRYARDAVQQMSSTVEGSPALYMENSGTSMAAPHVSGAIAAFLSIRREFIGQPRKVKEIFCRAATDLGRERYFQGRGLLDVMRAIQSI